MICFHLIDFFLVFGPIVHGRGYQLRWRIGFFGYIPLLQPSLFSLVFLFLLLDPLVSRCFENTLSGGLGLGWSIMATFFILFVSLRGSFRLGSILLGWFRCNMVRFIWWCIMFSERVVFLLPLLFRFRSTWRVLQCNLESASVFLCTYRHTSESRFLPPTGSVLVVAFVTDGEG